MTKFYNVAFLSTAVLLGAVGLSFAEGTAESTEAQTGTQVEAQATDVETQATGVESQLSLGTDPEAGPTVGQPYSKENIGDWEMRCIKANEGEEDPCQMYQMMDDGEGAPVAEFSLFRLPKSGKAKAGATVVVPLETSLTHQLNITIDGGGARRYPFAFCNTIGCYARIGLTADDVTRYKRGNVATITIVPVRAADQKVNLTLSLKGFTAAYEQVSTIQN